MSFSTLMDLAWILKMLALPSRSGRENSTLRSRRPGLIVTSSSVIKPGSANSVNFVKEDETSFLGSCHFKQFPDHSCSFSNIFLYQLRSDNPDKASI